MGIASFSHISLRSALAPESNIPNSSSSTMMSSTPGAFLHFTFLIASSILLLAIFNDSSSSPVYKWLLKCFLLSVLTALGSFIVWGVTVNFVYLGGNLSSKQETISHMERCIGIVRAAFQALEKVWSARDKRTAIKLQVYEILVWSCLLYNLNTWPMKCSSEQWLDVFEVACLRSILAYLEIGCAVMTLRNISIHRRK